MGSAAFLLTSGLAGMGMASAQKKQASAASSAAALQSVMAAEKPEAPGTPEASGDGNALMEAARERERQAALLRQRQAPELFTSGLGAAGQATTAKKSLLGG